MRITFLLPSFAARPLGGYRIIYEYANRLTLRGHDVAVVHPVRIGYEHRNPPANALQWLRMEAGALKRRVWTPRLTWFHVDPRVRMHFVPDASERHIPDGDVIFATFWATAEEVLRYGPAKGRKCYYIQSYETWGGPVERVDATWRAPLARIVIARWLVEQGIELGLAADDVTHVPLGLDSASFTVRTPIAERPPRVAMLGSTVPLKGLADGVRALELARAKLPALEAVLFGTEPRPSALPSWIEYRQQPPHDVLVDEVYNGAAVYLCPSWIEGWHLPPAEAMACGCALVSTDIGGVRDYAEHEVTALLSAPRQPDLLAANLIRLLSDDALRHRLAAAGRERIRSFDWSRSVDRFEAFLRRHAPAASSMNDHE
jgi:L-malate glycosyltransferase